jgi:hypothetical protein
MEYIYTYGHDDMEENLQIGKAVLLSGLFEEKHISKEVYLDYMKNYALIVKKPSFFNKLWEKLTRKGEKEGHRIILVKQFSLKDDQIPTEDDEQA